MLAGWLADCEGGQVLALFSLARERGKNFSFLPEKNCQLFPQQQQQHQANEFQAPTNFAPANATRSRPGRRSRRQAAHKEAFGSYSAVGKTWPSCQVSNDNLNWPPPPLASLALVRLACCRFVLLPAINFQPAGQTDRRTSEPSWPNCSAGTLARSGRSVLIKLVQARENFARADSTMPCGRVRCKVVAATAA